MTLKKEHINRIEKIYILAKTDFKQRYFDTALGIVWAFLNPLFRLLLFYFIFSYVFHHQTENYALYIFIGIIFWQFFSEATKKGLSLFISKRYLLLNIPIKKIDIFLAATLSTFTGFMFNCIMFLIISQFFPVSYSLNFIFFFVLLFLLFMFTLSISMILSTLYIYFRDINHLWDIVLLIGFWTMPIIWNQKLIMGKMAFVTYINPLAGVLINMRNVAIFNKPVDYTLLAYDFLIIAVLFVLSYLIMNHFSGKAMEKS